MPRYSNDDQFWEVTLAGNAIHTRFGAAGSKGEESLKTFPDAARAKAEHDKIVAFKEARGFALDGAPKPKKAKTAKPKPSGPQRDAKLEAVIAKNLDDVDAFRVYGDWLSEQGDVRGELIALQTKRGHDKAAMTLIDEHREHFLGDLHHLSEELLRLTWRNGFIDSIRIEKVSGSADDEDRTAGELLRALLSHPSGAFVRSLSFGTVDGIEDGNIDYESICAALGKVPAPHVSSIYFGDWDEWEVSWSHLGKAAPLWKLPALETLTIRAGSMDLGTIASSSLRSLEIITGGLTKANIKSLAAAKLPALETLKIYFGSSQYGASGDVKDLAPLLAGKGLPKLKHLGLMNAEFTDDICSALPKAPILRQLSTLDLSKGTMSSAGAAALAAHEQAFGHLAELDVSDNWLTGDDLKRLKGVAKKVITGDQRDAEDNDGERYVSLGE